MRLHRLRLVNFRQHADTEIALGAGITAIIGPNGAGKTTLLEAIAWAFYGNTAARGSRDTIRWNRAPARSSVRVEVDFAFGAHEFRVVRGMYNAELYQDRFDAPIATTQQEVSGRMERLLGMTRQEFFNTYFTGQKELAIMSSMTPSERAQFLSRVLGYERLKRVQGVLKEERTALRARLQELLARLPGAADLQAEEADAARRADESASRVVSAEAARVAADARVAEATPRWEAQQALQDRVRSLKADLRVAEQQVTNARDTHRTLDRELTEALAARVAN